MDDDVEMKASMIQQSAKSTMTSDWPLLAEGLIRRVESLRKATPQAHGSKRHHAPTAYLKNTENLPLFWDFWKKIFWASLFLFHLCNNALVQWRIWDTGNH